MRNVPHSRKRGLVVSTLTSVPLSGFEQTSVLFTPCLISFIRPQHNTYVLNLTPLLIKFILSPEVIHYYIHSHRICLEFQNENENILSLLPFVSFSHLDKSFQGVEIYHPGIFFSKSYPKDETEAQRKEGVLHKSHSPDINLKNGLSKFAVFTTIPGKTEKGKKIKKILMCV